MMGRLLFSLAIRTFPGPFRRAHESEMIEAFERYRTASVVRHGRWKGVLYSIRAAWDAMRQGWIERTRGSVPHGHGKPPEEPRGNGMFDGVTADVRLAWRTLRKGPGFTIAAALVLGLGVGANVTIFSALRATILTPPPFPAPDRLVVADRLVIDRTSGEAAPSTWSYLKFRVIADVKDRLIDPIAGYAKRPATLTEAGPPTRLDIEVVTPGYFAVLGQSPTLGRGFTADEDDVSAPPLVAVLSHELWTARFARDPQVIGKSLGLNGTKVTVVGVAPEGFRGLTGSASLWIPAAASGALINRFMVTGTQAHWMNVVGRLRDGATFANARAQMEAIGEAVARAYPSDDGVHLYGGSARRLEDVWVNEGARAAVMLLAAAAMLVLLVATANLSALLITRARRRARDGAVRLAIGASRWHLMRASLIESMILAAMGGSVGILLSIWGTRVMASAWPEQFVSSGDTAIRVVSTDAMTVDGGVLAFGCVMTLLTLVLFGVVPALRASWADLGSRLRGGTDRGRRSGRVLGMDLRAFLVGGQVALAFVLLAGTGLVGTSVRRLLDVDLGFDPDRLVTFRYSVPGESSWSSDLMGFHDLLLERLRALPGVESATVGVPPLGGHWAITNILEIEGRPPIPEGQTPSIGVSMVTPGYFDAFGIRQIDGRVLTDEDGVDASPTIVLNRTAARTLFPDGDAVGRHLVLGMSDEGKDRSVEVVGVVENALYRPPDEEQIAEAFYALREFPLPDGMLTLRTVSGDPTELLPAVRAVLAEIEPAMPISDVRTMEEMIAAATGDRRIVLALLGVFAAVTILLAATGTWGIVSYAVADRRRELGLRIALGAESRRVTALVLGQSAVATAAGVCAGLVGTAAGSRLLDAFLSRTGRGDPTAFGGSLVLLSAVVALASWLPARRATRIDPVEALRSD